jgi:hypothetical protein
MVKEKLKLRRTTNNLFLKENKLTNNKIISVEENKYSNRNKKIN